MMTKSLMVVGVVLLVCSSLCRSDIASHPALQDFMTTLNNDQVNSFKQALVQVQPLTSNALDIPAVFQPTANNAVNEVASNIASAGALQQAASNIQAQQAAEQIAGANSAAQQIAAANNAAQVLQVAAANSAAQQIAAENAAQAQQAIGQIDHSQISQFATPATESGLLLPSRMVPELPLSILSQLLPSIPLLPTDILAQLPSSIRSQLSPQVLDTLPTSALSDLPVDTLTKLSSSVLSDLPASSLVNLPQSVLSQLPEQALNKLPTNVLAGLPLSTLSGLSQNLLSRMVQDIVGQLPLPLPMLYQLTNLKELATPDAITNLLGVIDVFKTISGYSPQLS